MSSINASGGGGLEIPDVRLQDLRRNSLSNEGIRLANFRNYMFMLLRVTAGRFLKLTIQRRDTRGLK